MLRNFLKAPIGALLGVLLLNEVLSLNAQECIHSGMRRHLFDCPQ